MAIHEQELEISQRDESQLECGTYRFSTISRVQLPEQVVQMRLD